MTRHFYVSQLVEDTSTDPPPRKGAMHFITPDEVKARSEQAVDHATRFLLTFENAVLVAMYPTGCPEFLIASASRKEAQRCRLERQATEADSQAGV